MKLALLLALVPNVSDTPPRIAGKSITAENAHSLVSAGADRLAVGAGILEAPDPADAARRLAALLAG